MGHFARCVLVALVSTGIAACAISHRPISDGMTPIDDRNDEQVPPDVADAADISDAVAEVVDVPLDVADTGDVVDSSDATDVVDVPVDRPLVDVVDVPIDIVRDVPIDIPIPIDVRPDVVVIDVPIEIPVIDVPIDRGCAVGLTLCSGACVNTSTDSSNCGACGTVCPPPVANGRYTCMTGSCTLLCASGYILSSGTCVPRCGDRMLVGAESCDDGNTTGGDGCSTTCTVESGARFASCGSGTTLTTAPGLGRSLYLGNSSTAGADFAGACMADGFDEVWRFRVPTGATLVTITYTPTGYRGALRTATDTCTTQVLCTPGVMSGSAITASFGVTAGATFHVFADAMPAGAGGPYSLDVNFM